MEQTEQGIFNQGLKLIARQHYAFYLERHSCLKTIILDLSELTSSMLGAGIRTARHRLLIGAMTFDVELQHRINLQVAIYFSMVRRNACWASFVSLSTSVNSTTKNQQKESPFIT